MGMGLYVREGMFMLAVVHYKLKTLVLAWVYYCSEIA